MSAPLPVHIQQEVAYAADLLQRADKAISQELKHLRAAGVPLEHKELLDLDIAMSRVACRLRVIGIEAGRVDRSSDMHGMQDAGILHGTQNVPASFA